MKYILYFFLFIPIFIFSQKPKTYFIDKGGNKVTKKNAFYYRTVTKKYKKWYVEDFYLNGSIRMKTVFSDRYLKHYSDSITYYHINKVPSVKGKFLNNEKQGVWRMYSIIGKLKKSGMYDKGEIAGTWKWYDKHGILKYVVYDANKSKVKWADKRASFHGGQSELYKFLNTKSLFDKKYGSFNGYVYAFFSVDKIGMLDDIEIVVHSTKKVDSILLSRLKKMPKWNPPLKYGKPIKQWYTLPIKITSSQGHYIINRFANADSFFESALLDYKSSKIESAIRKLEFAISNNYQDPRFYALLALCYTEQKQIDFSCAYWKISDSLDKKMVTDKVRKACSF